MAPLVELIADSGAMLPQRGKLLEMPFRGERDHERKKAGGIRYLMNFQVESMSPMVYTKTHHDLARYGAHRGLFVPFPMWMARSLTPFSFIDYLFRDHNPDLSQPVDGKGVHRAGGVRLEQAGYPVAFQQALDDLCFQLAFSLVYLYHLLLVTQKAPRLIVRC